VAFCYGRRWRHRFLHWVKCDRPRQLTCIVEADETFLLAPQTSSRKLDREPRKRGGNAALRGIYPVCWTWGVIDWKRSGNEPLSRVIACQCARTHRAKRRAPLR